MTHLARTLLVVLVIAVAGTTVAAGVAGGQDVPEIQLYVDGDSTANGEKLVRQNANVSFEVTHEEPIETIIVEVGDERNYIEPSGSTYEGSLGLDLNTGWNRIEVIVTDGNGSVESRRHVWVYEDFRPPEIALSTPIEVESGHSFPEKVDRTEGRLPLSGTVSDVSNVSEFSLEVIQDGRSVQSTTHEDGAFSMNTSLGPGNATLRISATDRYDQETTRSTRIEVTDEEEPAVEIRNWPNRTRQSTIEPTLVATDDVAVRELRYSVPGQSTVTVIGPADPLLDAARDNVTTTVPIAFHRAGTYDVTFNVTDYENRYSVETKEIEYDPLTQEEEAVPDITIDHEASGLVDDGYRVRGTVSEGSVSLVRIEAVKNETGELEYSSSVYDGEPASNVTINRTIPIEDGVYDVSINVTDSYDNQHGHRWTLDMAKATPLETPTPSQTNESDSQTTEANDTTAATPTTTPIEVVEPSPVTPETGSEAPLPLALGPIAVLLVVILAGVDHRRE